MRRLQMTVPAGRVQLKVKLEGMLRLKHPQGRFYRGCASSQSKRMNPPFAFSFIPFQHYRDGKLGQQHVQRGNTVVLTHSVLSDANAGLSSGSSDRLNDD